jgi:hypothetical protein
MAHWTVRVRTTTENDQGKLIARNEVFLVRGESIEEAQKRVKEYFKDMTIDYEIRSASKSGIVGYIDSEGNASD